MIPEETLQLLRAIYRGQREGYLTLTAIHPTKKQSTPSRHLPIRDKDGIHQALSDLLRANQQGWGAYFSVALRKEPLGRWKRGGQADLLTLPALYADLDGDLSASFKRIRQAGLAGLPAPSALVGSGRGLHLYWFIQASSDFVLADRILTGLAQTLGGDAMKVTQALRLPGSHNTKSAVQRPCQLLWLAEDRRYNLSDFARFVPTPPESTPPPRAPPPHADQINPDVIDAVTRTLMRDWSGFVQKNGWVGAICPGGHRHDAPGQHFAFSPRYAVAKCQGRHGQLLLKELCDLLQIDPAHYGGLYRPTVKERTTPMAKKKAKNQETIIMIRLPDVDDSQGVGTLSIQRGELGQVGQFAYRGLTLKGNLAEAVQAALLKLVQLEAAPPPDLDPESAANAIATTDPNEDEKSVSSVMTLEGVEPAETPLEIPQKAKNPPESAENQPQKAENPTVSTQTDNTDTDTSNPEKMAQIAQKSPKKVPVSAGSKNADTSANQQQMTLF